MSTPVVCALGILLALWAVSGRTGGASVVLLTLASHTVQLGAGVATLGLPTITRYSALVPNTEGKPPRKTTSLTVPVSAVLTVSTLLLYNVRSR
jgi:hypothetical protein